MEKHLDINSFDYTLPQELIAQYPLKERDASRLLIYRDEIISEDIFANIADHLPGESTIIFNNTRVIRARLIFTKNTGATIEIFCLEPVLPVSELHQAFLRKESCTWNCLVGNVKRWKEGDLHKIFFYEDRKYELTAILKGENGEGCFLVEFRWTPATTTFSEILEIAGNVPLPPYIEREAAEGDTQRYQTIYAEQQGSVAAPTAGLHFTDSVMEKLRAKKMDFQKVTLHVGLGTFRPVSKSDIACHVMHEEKILIRTSVIKQLASARNNVIAVGTTSVRTIESLYWAGVKLIVDKQNVFEIGQWDPYDERYDIDIPVQDAMKAVSEECEKDGRDEFSANTRLMIVPGYKFRLTDVLITNFHQPQSTLLLLVAAFIGEKWKEAYEFAIQNKFRFLSYGDACLFFRR